MAMNYHVAGLLPVLGCSMLALALCCLTFSSWPLPCLDAGMTGQNARRLSADGPDRFLQPIPTQDPFVEQQAASETQCSSIKQKSICRSAKHCMWKRTAGGTCKEDSSADVPVTKVKVTGRTLFLLGDEVAETFMGPSIAAASASSGNKPAVLVMSKSLGPFGFDDAVKDYLRRYRPERTWTVGVSKQSRKKLADMNFSPIRNAGPFETSCMLARRVWKRAAELVVVNATSYEDALIAAPLAAKRSAPLVLVEEGSSGKLEKLIKKLAVRSVWTVGEVSVEVSAPQTQLHGSVEVAKVVGSTEYVAVTNPGDRMLPEYKSLSLMAPLIAAARGGTVLNLKGDSLKDWTASSITDQVKTHMSTLGLAKYLAIVGGPNAIPFHVFHSGVGKWETEKVHDAPYANLDSDPFLDLAVGRLVAKNLASMSLITSRISTYEHLRNGDWELSSAIAGDLQQAMYVLTPALTNVGFVEERLSQKDVEDTPVLEKSAIIHNAHSWYGGLGGFFSTWSQTLLAPAVVTSSGCSTAGIDRSGPDGSVALRLLHQGAVSFMGAPHNAVTRGKLTHHAFWDAVLRGETLGNAFAEAINDWVVVVEEEHNGNPIHASQNIVLFGDPALQMYIPQEPAVLPARLEQQGDLLTAHAPKEWVLNSETSALAHEWKWPGNLFYYGAPGVVSLYWWGGKYDKSKQFLFARYHTTSDESTNVRLVKTNEAPDGLGWTGDLHVDKHMDGSRTLLWRVRLLDFDVETGNVTTQLISQSFRVVHD